MSVVKFKFCVCKFSSFHGLKKNESLVELPMYLSAKYKFRILVNSVLVSLFVYWWIGITASVDSDDMFESSVGVDRWEVLSKEYPVVAVTKFLLLGKPVEHDESYLHDHRPTKLKRSK